MSSPAAAYAGVATPSSPPASKPSTPIFVPPPRNTPTTQPQQGQQPNANSSSAPAASASTAAPTQTSGSDPQLHLSTFQSLLHCNAHYGSDLWDAIPAVADQSELSKGFLVRLSRFLKDKAELDKSYAQSLKKLVLKLQVPDVPRVADIPMPPQAAAQVAQAVVAGGSALAAHTAAVAATAAAGTAGAANVAAGAPSPVDPRSFDRFMMAFRNLHMTLATNQEILSAKIVEQVYKPLAIHRDAHAHTTKRLLAELDKYTAAYQKYLDGLLASRAACQKACQESEAMRRKLEHAVAAGGGNGGGGSGGGGNGSGNNVVNDLVGAFKADSASLAKRALIADGKYIAAVKSMRGFRMATDSTLSHLLDQFESLENGKTSASRETLMHYLTIQSQMFGSNVKNLAAVQSVGDKVNAHVDTQHFISAHRTFKLPIPLPEYSVFKGHPNYTAVKKEEDAINAGEALSLGGAGVHSASAAAAAAGMQGGEWDGSEERLQHSGSGSSVVAAPKGKSSGWGWLNTIAAALPGVNTKPHRASIDHDSESVLTRGSNYYDRATAGSSSVTTQQDEFGVDDDSASASPPVPAQQPRRAMGGGGGYGASEDAGDEAEEKSPERVQAEQQLSDYFDAMTGRVQLNAPDGGRSSPDSTASPGSAHEAVTYSPARERDLTAAELARSDALFATVEGRKSFASVLNRQRNTSGGLKLSSRSSLARLAAWTRRFLDQAQTHMHVDPVQLTMIMCQSFYIEEEEEAEEEEEEEVRSDGGSNLNDSDRRAPRTYLLSLIRTHPIWKEVRFW